MRLLSEESFLHGICVVLLSGKARSRARPEQMVLWQCWLRALPFGLLEFAIISAIPELLNYF